MQKHNSPTVIPLWAKRVGNLAVGNWQLVSVGIVTVVTGGWAYLSHHGYLETGLLALWTFVGLLLAIGGVLWLHDRHKPRQIRVAHDLDWGLAYQGINAYVDPAKEDCFFQLGLLLRNVSAHTIEMVVTRFDVVIGTRTLAKGEPQPKALVIPRHSVRSYRHPPFQKNALIEYFGKSPEGSAEFWIAYGRAGEPKTRCLHMKLDLYFRVDLAGTATVTDVIAFENDSEVPAE